jgi:4-amino-4-deoxy-L-arabinose transferase-like glycosyltransferase
MINSDLKNKIYILLVGIIFLAGILRFYKIDEIPVSLYWDEASIAYNAFSIAETGRDEYGKTFPLLFKAFDDFKTPGYVYLTAIAVKLFGLNEFSTRFFSALLGTLTILSTFLFIREFIRRKLFEVEPDYIALLVALLVAIAPVHIQFSRAGFEANAGLFFIVTGAYLFFKFVNSLKYKFLYSSITLFAISIYFYRSLWIFVPLFLTGIFLIFHKLLFKRSNLKNTILAVFIFIIILLPFIPQMISQEASGRANETSVINNSHDAVYRAILKMEESGPIGKIIYNRRVVYLEQGIRGYVSHFSPNFLFFSGDNNLRHGVGSVGIFYIWGLIFIIPGIYLLLKIDRKIAFTIILWLLIAPLPAAFSVPAPHSLRSLNMIPMLQVLIAFGIIWTLFKIGKKYRKAAIAVFIGIGLYFFTNYLSIYFGTYPAYSSRQWADGYKELASYVFENEKEYEKVLITGHYWQPHIYFLFYKKFDPALFQSTGSKTGFDKYIFSGTHWDNEGREFDQENLVRRAGTEDFLVALSPDEYRFQKKNINTLKKIYNESGELIFIIGKNDK